MHCRAARGAETLADLARSLHVSPDDFEHAAEIARRFGISARSRRSKRCCLSRP
jgi:hypothetical protein